MEEKREDVFKNVSFRNVKIKVKPWRKSVADLENKLDFLELCKQSRFYSHFSFFVCLLITFSDHE